MGGTIITVEHVHRSVRLNSTYMLECSKATFPFIVLRYASKYCSLHNPGYWLVLCWMVWKGLRLVVLITLYYYKMHLGIGMFTRKMLPGKTVKCAAINLCVLNVPLCTGQALSCLCGNAHMCKLYCLEALLCVIFSPAQATRKCKSWAFPHRLIELGLMLKR